MVALTCHLTWASVSSSGGWEMVWVLFKAPSILNVMGLTPLKPQCPWLCPALLLTTFPVGSGNAEAEKVLLSGFVALGKPAVSSGKLAWLAEDPAIEPEEGEALRTPSPQGGDQAG